MRRVTRTKCLSRCGFEIRLASLPDDDQLAPQERSGKRGARLKDAAGREHDLAALSLAQSLKCPSTGEQYTAAPQPPYTMPYTSQ